MHAPVISRFIIENFRFFSPVTGNACTFTKSAFLPDRNPAFSR
jgi:hypothetical protein